MSRGIIFYITTLLTISVLIFTIGIHQGVYAETTNLKNHDLKSSDNLKSDSPKSSDNLKSDSPKSSDNLKDSTISFPLDSHYAEPLSKSDNNPSSNVISSIEKQVQIPFP